MRRGVAFLFIFLVGGHVFGQKNAFGFQQTSSLHTLDSLIHAAPSLALRTSDYGHGCIDSLLARPKNLVMNSADSLQIIRDIKQVALHFFEDLRYGNKAPKLDFMGQKNSVKDPTLEAKVDEAWVGNSLGALAKSWTARSLEVQKLMEALARWTEADPWKKTDILEAIQEYRWLSSLKSNQNIVLVSIPRAELQAYQKTCLIVSMKVVVGKVENPTRTLLSRFHTLIINPFWYVPKRIATKELLPKILKNKHYFEDNQMQVLNSRNEVIDPTTVNWKTLGPHHFPYTLRQSSGCDNSLGLMKLQFQSPFTIYLHDSPEKNLFQASQRYFSHGCVRLEKPLELGRWLLGKNKIALDTVKSAPNRINPQSVTVPLTGNTLLLIWYPKIEVNAAGEIIRNADIYHKFPQE